MKDSDRDVWDAFSLLLWALFFLCGLVPEPVFYALRDAGSVTTQTALINSSLAITLLFSAYFAFFVFRRSKDAGAPLGEAQARALQAFVLCLVAFLEFPPRGTNFEIRTILELVVRVGELSDGYLQFVVLLVGGGKMLAWCYLVTLVLRYHAFGKRDVFARAVALFPGPRRGEEPLGPPPAPAKFISKPPAPPTQKEFPDDNR